MLGAGQVYDCLPYFFSDQYDVGMEYSGFARTWDRVVFRGDPANREFIAFWLAGDRVLAGSGGDAPPRRGCGQARATSKLTCSDRRGASTVRRCHRHF